MVSGMDGGFYVSADCPECDEEVIYGLCVTTLEHKGRPLIPYDVAAQTSFSCQDCGAQFYTGDLELFTA